MTDERPSVLVLVPPTWIGALGAMRSLRQLGVSVYGLAHNSISVSNASRYCAGTIRAAADGRPHGDPRQLVSALLAGTARTGAGTILIAGTDEWAVFVAEHSGELMDRYRFPVMPAEVVRELASKEGLFRLGRAHGMPTPRIAIPQTAEDVNALADSLVYPVMLKPVHSRPDVFRKAVATDPASLLKSYTDMSESPTEPNVMLQEYIPGSDEDVWMFNGYFDSESRCLAAFTGQKVRQLPAHMGHCSLGVSYQNQTVIDQTIRFLQAIGYRGIVDIGYRFDRRDGQYKVLDVNPRLGGAFRLFVDRNGLDVVRALYLDLTGRPVPAVVPWDGRRWFREDSELVAFWQYRRLHRLTLRSWLRSLRGADETSTFALADPKPFVCSMLLLGRATLAGRRRSLAVAIRGAIRRWVRGIPRIRPMAP